VIFTKFLQTLYAVARLLTGLIALFDRQRERQAGEDRAAAQALKEQIIRVKKARAARRSVVPGRLPDDDPNRRD
jgi:hypothetical protein